MGSRAALGGAAGAVVGPRVPGRQYSSSVQTLQRVAANTVSVQGLGQHCNMAVPRVTVPVLRTGDSFKPVTAGSWLRMATLLC